MQEIALNVAVIRKTENNNIL